MLKRNFIHDTHNKKSILTYYNEQQNKTLSFIDHSHLQKPQKTTKKKIIFDKNQKTQNKRKSNSSSPLKIPIKPIKKQNIKTQKTKQKLLVVDLDETLVHTSFDYIENPNLIITIDLEDENNQINKCNLYINIRPGAKEFIEELSYYYEIIIFTASSEKYANTIMNIIDIKNKVSHKMFRDDCTILGDVYIKDLNKIGRELKDIVIIDNNIFSFAYQQENGIPIKNWYDDYNDLELYKLIPILKNLEGFYDVRTEIPKFVNNNTFIWMKSINWLKDYMLNSIFYEELKKVLEMERSISINQSNNIYNYNKENEKKNIEMEIIHNDNLKKRNFKKSLAQSNLLTNSCNDFIKITNNFFFDNNKNTINNNNNQNIKIEDETIQNYCNERLMTDGNDKSNQNEKIDILKRSSSLKKNQFTLLKNANINKSKGLKIKNNGIKNKLNMNENTLFNLFKKSKVKKPIKNNKNINHTTNYKNKKIYDIIPSKNNSINNSKNY